MNSLTKLVSGAALSLSTIADPAQAQAIGGASRHTEVCAQASESAARDSTLRGKILCVSDMRDTTIREEGFTMYGNVFTERVQGTSKKYLVLKLLPAMYQGNEIVRLSREVQSALSQRPYNGHIVRFEMPK